MTTPIRAGQSMEEHNSLWSGCQSHVMVLSNFTELTTMTRFEPGVEKERVIRNAIALSYNYTQYHGTECEATLTMLMTIRLRACRCFTGTFCRMLQPVSCSSLNATARWWFSSTDSSLYISANSEPTFTYRHINTISVGTTNNCYLATYLWLHDLEAKAKADKFCPWAILRTKTVLEESIHGKQ